MRKYTYTKKVYECESAKLYATIAHDYGTVETTFIMKGSDQHYNISFMTVEEFNMYVEDNGFVNIRVSN